VLNKAIIEKTKILCKRELNILIIAIFCNKYLAFNDEREKVLCTNKTDKSFYFLTTDRKINL
jgi:hypothetical protein